MIYINNNNAIYFQPGGAGTLRIIRAGYKALITDNNDIPNKEYGLRHKLNFIDFSSSPVLNSFLEIQQR